MVLPLDQRGRRGPQPVAAALHHADRARADPEASRGRARREARVLQRGGLARAGRRRRHRRRARARRRLGAHGARALRRRRRRRGEPDATAARDREPRPRQLLGQHHDLLPGRRARADRRPQPQRGLRLPPAPGGVLPVLVRGRRGLPRRQRDDRRGGRAAHGRRRGHERRAVHRVRSARARRSGHPGRDRERPALERERRLGRALPGRPDLPRRRLGARDAADGRLRGQRRRARRRQPRVEARRRAERRGGSRPARDLRRRAPTRRRVHRRAGLHPLRPAARPGARQGEPDADRRRGDGRARLPLPLRRGDSGARRGRLAVGGPARADGAPRLARASLRPRRRALDARPVRAGLRRAHGPQRHRDEEIEEHRIDDPGFAEAYGIGPAGAVLVRPDGFVAWRTQEASVEGLRSALATVRQSGAR